MATQLTTGDLRMDGGASGEINWDMITGVFRRTSATGFTMTDGAFKDLNGLAAAQPSLQSLMDSPSPFGSALTTLSPDAIMASPPAYDDSCLVSSRAQCAACCILTSRKPFTFKSPGMQSDATPGGSLCMRS